MSSFPAQRSRSSSNTRLRIAPRGIGAGGWADMRFLAGLACAIVALDSAEFALGIASPAVFTGEYIWLWWIPTIGWAMTSVSVFVAGAE